MNDYMKLIAHAAMKYTDQPVVLSPLLDNYCGWENKKSRLSSEPVKDDMRIILSVTGLTIEELEVECDEFLKVCLKHDSKVLGENDFKWSRDCTYTYAVKAAHVPFLSAYWTNDDFLIIQARQTGNFFATESKVKDLQKFKLLPVDIINVLEPALNVPFLKQILKAVQKKSSDIMTYVNSAAEIPEAKDFLCLLSCIPLAKKKMNFDFKDVLEGASAAMGEQSSQEESDAEKSKTDSEDQSPTKKISASAKRETRQTKGKTKSK